MKRTVLSLIVEGSLKSPSKNLLPDSSYLLRPIALLLFVLHTLHFLLWLIVALWICIIYCIFGPCSHAIQTMIKVEELFRFFKVQVPLKLGKTELKPSKAVEIQLRRISQAKLCMAHLDE